MGAHSAGRHGHLAGRSVSELLDRAAARSRASRTNRPSAPPSIPEPRNPPERHRSAFSLVAATAMGAGAAASMTGVFAAVPAATSAPAKPSDTQEFARVPVHPVALTASPAAPAAQPHTAQPAARPAHALPAGAPAAAPAAAPGTVPADAVSAAGPLPTAPAVAATVPLLAAPEKPASGGGTVLAADLHQTDATQIAALSRSVNMAAAAAEQAKKQSFILFGSPIAKSALSEARSKLGVPYVWGAAGPNAFDCSGLVQWAFKQVGVRLPRVAAAQSQVGTPVSRNNLRPGDLVFFYSPVSHVGIYIGDNKILHASEPGEPVKISDMTHFPFHNARRV
jgi:peptidoglycan DL-endopeptidase CwlO